MTPTTTGTYKGKCYELCGVSHSRMLFNVEVVSPDEYDAYLDELADAGDASEEPLIGGEYVREQVGLEADARGGVRVTATAAPHHRGHRPQAAGPAGRPVLTTTDHKVIGKLYLVTSFAGS